MSEKEFNNNIFSHSDPKEQNNDSFNASQSTSEVEIPKVNAKPIVIEKKPAYSYEHYTSQFAEQSSSAISSKTKKTKKGRKIALIACSLALAVCLGFGGGVLGSYIMGGNSETKVKTVSTTVEGKSVAASTSEGNDSGLTVIEASNTDKTKSSIEEVVAEIKDSVVEITTESTSYSSFYGQYVTQGAGSGVVISADGYIVTNHHVIEDASNVNVRTTDGKSYEAKVIGSDETFDVALIKIEADNLTVAALGDSSKLNVGQTSIVIGNPLGQLGGTVTKGIVSALNRNIKIDGQTMELLQTDAAINPGNSGGGMFDENGNLIGIVVAKSIMTNSGTTVEGIGFAIPINNVKNIIGDLKEKGYVSGRAALGVTLTDVLSENAMKRYGVDKQGVYISSITSGGAAEKAGLTVGDMVTKFDGKEVKSSSEMSAAVLKHKAGDKVTITISRDGKEEDINVELGEAKSDKSSEGKYSNGFNPGNSGSSNGSNGYGFNNDDDWYRYFME